MMQELREKPALRRRIRWSADLWAALIAAQATSGMSISAFCRERGVGG